MDRYTVGYELYLFCIFQVYSKDSKHRSDSLDEASQFSDLEDQMGTSPAHRPIDKEVSHIVSKTEVKTITVVSDKTEHARDQTLEFLKYESEYSAQIHAPTLDTKDAEKVGMVNPKLWRSLNIIITFVIGYFIVELLYLLFIISLFIVRVFGFV